MAKQSGLAFTTLSIDDSGGTPEDVRNDCTNIQWATPRAVQDVTGLDKSAMERLLLLADASITLNFVANFANSPSIHDVLKTVPSTSVARTTTIGIGGKSLPNEILYTDYQLTRGNDGALTGSAPGVLTGGVVPTWA